MPPLYITRKRVRLVEKICTDCKRPFEVTACAVRTVRCPACQTVIERARDNRRTHRVRGGSLPKIGGDLRIVHDPDGSWTPNASLTPIELRTLLDLEYIAEGTVIEGRRRQRVTRCDGKLRLTGA